MHEEGGEKMVSIKETDLWHTAHPGAVIGLLELKNVDNPLASPQLNHYKHAIEMRLRKDYAGYSRQEFLALPVMAAYQRYYKRFNKTYHVLLQLESIVLKGKNLPDVSPLVDANFTAEMETLILTAGHDVSKLEGPVSIDVSQTDDEITQLNGITRPIRPGDMVMRDRHGICCSILYGQDNRSQITADTRHVLYVAYVPPGVPVDTLHAHLSQITENVRLFSAGLIVEQSRLLAA